MEYRIAICDDELIQIELITEYLNIVSIRKNVELVIDTYKSGVDLLNCNSDVYYSIIFLDIQIGNEDGIEVAKKIRERDSDVIIIFVTGYKEYVFDGYDVRAFNYLLKPVIYERFEEVFNNAIKTINNEFADKGKYFIIKKGSNLIKYNYNEIMYFESYGRLIKVRTKKDTQEYYGKIKELDEQLKDTEFIRCHLSYIVNSNYIHAIDKKELVLENELIIPVSRNRLQNVWSKFLQIKDE